MGAIFEAQFTQLREAFGRGDRDGGSRDIRVARNRAGHPLYIYEADRLLVQAGPDDDRSLTDPVRDVLRRRGIEPGERTLVPDVVILDTQGQDVPELLDEIDRQTGHDPYSDRSAQQPGPAARVVGPNHVVGITKICPAGEPTVPDGDACGPWPAQVPAPQTGPFPVRVGVSDTGLSPVDGSLQPWLGEVDGAEVLGDPDDLGPLLPSGLPWIREFSGHGMFIAGVVRCAAPTAAVYVNDHFSRSGGELEDVMIGKLDRLVTKYRPQVVNLSAGTYSRRDWEPLGLSQIARRLRDDSIVLVTAAGNDSTDRPFYPAALPRAEFPNIVSVGALGADLANFAWFSNYGSWVDVYALGEMRNAYPVGEYVYQEQPRQPNRQQFTRGIARWEGTSFSAPFVAGLIADRIARTGESPTDATAVVLAAARTMPGIGRVLLPGTRP